MSMQVSAVVASFCASKYVRFVFECFLCPPDAAETTARALVTGSAVEVVSRFQIADSRSYASRALRSPCWLQCPIVPASGVAGYKRGGGKLWRSTGPDPLCLGTRKEKTKEAAGKEEERSDEMVNWYFAVADGVPMSGILLSAPIP